MASRGGETWWSLSENRSTGAVGGDRTVVGHPAWSWVPTRSGRRATVNAKAHRRATESRRPKPISVTRWTPSQSSQASSPLSRRCRQVGDGAEARDGRERALVVVFERRVAVFARARRSRMTRAANRPLWIASWATPGYAGHAHQVADDEHLGVAGEGAVGAQRRAGPARLRSTDRLSGQQAGERGGRDPGRPDLGGRRHSHARGPPRRRRRRPARPARPARAGGRRRRRESRAARVRSDSFAPYVGSSASPASSRTTLAVAGSMLR